MAEAPITDKLSEIQNPVAKRGRGRPANPATIFAKKMYRDYSGKTHRRRGLELLGLRLVFEYHGLHKETSDALFKKFNPFFILSATHWNRSFFTFLGGIIEKHDAKQALKIYLVANESILKLEKDGKKTTTKSLIAGLKKNLPKILALSLAKPIGTRPRTT